MKRLLMMLFEGPMTKKEFLGRDKLFIWIGTLALQMKEALYCAALFVAGSLSCFASVIDLDFSNQSNIVSSSQGTDVMWGLGPSYSENTLYFRNVAQHGGVSIDAKITTTVHGTYTWETHFPNYKQNTASEPNGDIGFRYWSSSLGSGGLNYLFEFYDGTGPNAGSFATPYVLEKFEIIAYDVDGENRQSENLRVKFEDGLVAWQTGTTSASLTATPSVTDVLFEGPRENQDEDDPTGAVLLHFENSSAFTLYFESQTFSGNRVNPIFSAIDGNWDLAGFGGNIGLDGLPLPIIPEPSSFVLLSLAGLTLFRRRR